MSRFVVDASVGIKWFIPEVHAQVAGQLQHSTNQLHVPAFFLLELVNVLTKKIRRKELLPKEAETMLMLLSEIPVKKHSDDELLLLAYTLAVETGRSVYDCLYLALAEVINGTVVTADKKFYSALSGGPFGKRMLWVEELEGVL